MRKTLFQTVKYVNSVSGGFEIPEERISGYEPPRFGFNGLGELVFCKTYSRMKEDGTNESFFDCIKRVVEGSYSIQKGWCIENDLEWDEDIALSEALMMFDKMYNFKFLPSGRGMFSMGTRIVDINAGQPLNSCGYVSTEGMRDFPSKPFQFMMDNSMLGVGVGFDTKGADTVKIIGPDVKLPIETYVIEDSRDGWVLSTKSLLDSYFHKEMPAIQFDYSLIRKAGEPLKLFGGISAGPFPLMNLHSSLRELLENHRNQKLSSRNIVDIMNMIGKCVISGNIRRTAEIAFGEAFDTEFYDLKDYTKHPDRSGYGWASRNNIFAELGMGFEEVCERIFKTGEPGLAWLHNMRQFGRMRTEESEVNMDVMGISPGMEQSLESFELCNLVETFPAHHDTGQLEEYLETLEYAMIYSKSVTLLETNWEESNEIMRRNRKVGVSMSGLAQFLSDHSLTELKKWCEAGYEKLKRVDQRISERFGVNESVKMTSIKPSKTISLLAGATPGMHFPQSRHYIHRIQLSKQSGLIPRFYECGYTVDEDISNQNCWIVEFPIHAGKNVRSCEEVSMWEKLNLAAYLQEHWADNQVSCTVSFDPSTTRMSDLTSAMEFYQYKLKGVAFEPRRSKSKKMGQQMKFEEISEEKYLELVNKINPDKLGLASNYFDEGKQNFHVEEKDGGPE